MRDFGLEQDDAEVVVVLAALFHCVGMSIHRHGHEDFSLFLSEPKLRELLDGLYEEPDKTVIVSEVLQAIISHRADGAAADGRRRHRPRRGRARHGEGPLADPVREGQRLDALALGGGDRGRRRSPTATTGRSRSRSS